MNVCRECFDCVFLHGRGLDLMAVGFSSNSMILDPLTKEQLQKTKLHINADICKHASQVQNLDFPACSRVGFITDLQACPPDFSSEHLMDDLQAIFASLVLRSTPANAYGILSASAYYSH
uniref:Uncharacterized protein n=1 Tax=Sphaerodactylus townsendi TaxID=933632 RepID=A0ACB8EVI5_9SAUR